MTMAKSNRMAVVGYGYWGPNVVRNIDGQAGASVVAVCDQSAAARARAEKGTLGVYVTADANEIVTSPDIDAVAIVTPVWTHYELAKKALENGKHVAQSAVTLAGGQGHRAGGARDG